jgi:hypothetical protein
VLRICVLLALLAYLASPARAQPALTAPVLAPVAVPRIQVEVAPALGSTYDGDLYAGLAAAGSYSINDLVAIHGAVEAAKARVVHFAGIDQYEGTSDRFAEARGGVELRHCMRESLCGIAGVDVGYRRETLSGNGAMDLSGPEAVARFGLDVGTRQVRFRPVFEGTSTHHGDTGALLLGVGYRF